MLQEAEKTHQEDLEKKDRHRVEMETKMEGMLKHENQLQAKV